MLKKSESGQIPSVKWKLPMFKLDSPQQDKE
jgi:hypothetical protein